MVFVIVQQDTSNLWKLLLVVWAASTQYSTHCRIVEFITNVYISVSDSSLKTPIFFYHELITNSHIFFVLATQGIQFYSLILNSVHVQVCMIIMVCFFNKLFRICELFFSYENIKQWELAMAISNVWVEFEAKKTKKNGRTVCRLQIDVNKRSPVFFFLQTK